MLFLHPWLFFPSTLAHLLPLKRIGLTVWLPSWRQRGFRTASGEPVKNRALIEYLDALIALRDASGQKVHFEHVYGHVGIEGNEGADGLANQGALLPEEEERDWEAERAGVERLLAEMRGKTKREVWQWGK